MSVPWLGEIEGSSLAILQANDSAVLARLPIFGVLTVLQPYAAGVPPSDCCDVPLGAGRMRTVLATAPQVPFCGPHG